MIAPPPATKDIEDALRRHGVRPRALALVSTLGVRKGRRWAYRVDTEDGRIVKARLFETDDLARSMFELRADLEHAFAPALARYGSLLLEEWVEGMPLASVDWQARLEEAGALLGRLHATPLGREVAVSLQTAQWCDGARSNLALLGTAGRLTPGEISRLQAEVLRRDPTEARAALVHLDFCADNMLIDRSGRLRIIDNELVTIAPAALDLARTFDLWPMSASAWVRFRSGYASAGAAEPGAAGFWRIVTTLTNARIFLDRSAERLDAALARLRRYLDGVDLEDS